jgi:hypothetical protein
MAEGIDEYAELERDRGIDRTTGANDKQAYKC